MIKIQEWKVKNITSILNNDDYWNEVWDEDYTECKNLTEDEAINFVLMQFIGNNIKYINN